jgi:hypothetical protein
MSLKADPRSFMNCMAELLVATGHRDVVEMQTDALAAVANLLLGEAESLPDMDDGKLLQVKEGLELLRDWGVYVDADVMSEVSREFDHRGASQAADFVDEVIAAHGPGFEVLVERELALRRERRREARWGHCDECGSPCDGIGCTFNRSHKHARDSQSE